MMPTPNSYLGAPVLGAAEGAVKGVLKPVEDPSGSYWDQKADQIKKGVVEGAVIGRAKYLGKNWFGF